MKLDDVQDDIDILCKVISAGLCSSCRYKFCESERIGAAYKTAGRKFATANLYSTLDTLVA